MESKNGKTEMEGTNLKQGLIDCWCAMKFDMLSASAYKFEDSLEERTTEDFHLKSMYNVL